MQIINNVNGEMRKQSVQVNLKDQIRLASEQSYKYSPYCRPLMKQKSYLFSVKILKTKYDEHGYYLSKCDTFNGLYYIKIQHYFSLKITNRICKLR